MPHYEIFPETANYFRLLKVEADERDDEPFSFCRKVEPRKGGEKVPWEKSPEIAFWRFLSARSTGSSAVCRMIQTQLLAQANTKLMKGKTIMKKNSRELVERVLGMTPERIEDICWELEEIIELLRFSKGICTKAVKQCKAGKLDPLPPVVQVCRGQLRWLERVVAVWQDLNE